MSRKEPNPSAPTDRPRPPPPPPRPLRRITLAVDASDKFKRPYKPRRCLSFGPFAADGKPGHPKIARPVFPNVGVEIWYRDKLQKLIYEMSASVLTHVRAAWKQADPDIGFATDAPNSSILLRKALEKWGGLWIGKLNDLSDELAKRFADKATEATDAGVAASFDSSGFTVKFRPTEAVKTAYNAVVAENVNLIKSIPQQYLKDVQTSVWDNVMRGGDLASLSKTIQTQYGKTYRRAALIARDQNAKAKALIENVRRQQLGITQAIWMHSHAGKEPRPTHVAMNGKPYKLSHGLYDSEAGKNIWPGELINCRCTSRAVIPGFEVE